MNYFVSSKSMPMLKNTIFRNISKKDLEMASSLYIYFLRRLKIFQISDTYIVAMSKKLNKKCPCVNIF